MDEATQGHLAAVDAAMMVIFKTLGQDETQREELVRMLRRFLANPPTTGIEATERFQKTLADYVHCLSG